MLAGLTPPSGLGQEGEMPEAAKGENVGQEARVLDQMQVLECHEYYEGPNFLCHPRGS